MKGINFRAIPHEEQRYPTVGDWWIDEEGIWQVRVSKMSDWRYEFLVFFHEILELAWCEVNGISQADVDAFDIEYENNREEGNTSEPGDDSKAPYRIGHYSATLVEKMACVILGCDWKEYEHEVNSL